MLEDQAERSARSRTEQSPEAGTSCDNCSAPQGAACGTFAALERVFLPLNELTRALPAGGQEAVPGGGSEVPSLLPWPLTAEFSAKQLLMPKPACPGSSHMLPFQCSPLSPLKGCEGWLGDRDKQIVVPLSSPLYLPLLMLYPPPSLSSLVICHGSGQMPTLLSFLDSPS